MLSGSLDPYGMPRVRLAVRGPYGSDYVDVIVDTGFGGTLSLPPDVIRKLGLLRHGTRLSVFADGSRSVTYTFWGEVEWLTGWMSLEILQGGSVEAMVGASLLRGHELVVNYGPAQSVEIR